MDVRQPTFQLLPDWNYRLNDPVGLGRLIPQKADSDLPDIDETLEDVRFEVSETRITTQSFKHWEQYISKARSVKGGVTADVSFFTGIGTGLSGNRSKQVSLKIVSENAKKITFRPTQRDLESVVEMDFIKSMLDKRGRKAVFLVTGVMVVDGAEITEYTKRGHGGGANANVDLSSVATPVNLGVNGELDLSNTNSAKQTFDGEFLVGYQLVRFQRKIARSTYEISRDNPHALYSDEIVLSDILEPFQIDAIEPEET